MFCSNCGKELEEGVTVCPECGTDMTPPEPKKRPKLSLPPLTVVGALFSSIAFVFGFILITTALVRGGVGIVDMIVLIPAFVGFGIGVYSLAKGAKNHADKFVSLLSAGASLFILLYTFIAYMVVVAG